MPLNQIAKDAHLLNPFTLEFRDQRVELEYRYEYQESLCRQARIALILGLVIWGMYSLFDLHIFSGQAANLIKLVYFSVLITGMSVAASTQLAIFRRFNQSILMAISLIAGIGLLTKMLLLPEKAMSQYFPGLLLLIFWSHNFTGLRFLRAGFVSLMLVVLALFLFIYVRPIAIANLVSYIYYLIAGIIFAVCSSYMAEWQQRTTYLRKRALDDERMHHLTRSLHDNLTGLPNRELLNDRLELAISQAVRDDRPSAGFFIDLDGFKAINDTYGHQVGDLVLLEVSKRFKEVMRETDTLSRIGGDEFFVLAKDISTESFARFFAEKLLNQLNQTFNLGDAFTLPGLTASIGICIFPYKHCTAVDIIRRADHAMLEVKRNEKAGILFA